MKLYQQLAKTMVLLLSLTLGGIWIFHSLSIVFFDSKWDGTNADCAIILGAAIWGDVPSPVYRARLDYAIQLAQENHVKRLIFTGGVGYEKKLSEGEVGKNYALKRGLKEDTLFVENQSRTTKQNIVNSLPILQQQQCSRILIVSDPYHLKRAVEIAQDLHLNAHPAATPSTMFRSWKTKLEFLISETYYLLQYRVTGYS